MVDADALILHLNPLQEVLQPEGEVRFADLLGKIEAVCKGLGVPVIVKEVGYGISADVARGLADVGVSAIDIAGAGGTSWSQVEMYRNKVEHMAKVAATFHGWGIPTADSIQAVKSAVPVIPIFASGGLRNGVDIAKCIALGAVLGGMAAPFLKAASVSLEKSLTTIAEISREIQICMFLVSAQNIDRLQQTPLVRRTNA